MEPRERAKASRLRRKGNRLRPAEHLWLRDFDQRRERERAERRDDPPPSLPATAIAPPLPDELPPLPAPAVDAPPPPGEEPIPFDGDGDEDDENDDTAPPSLPAAPPAEGHPMGTPVLSCGDPKCMWCSRGIGAYMCPTTGKLTWAPMDKRAADLLAKGLLAACALLVKFVRNDKQYIAASAEEVSQLGEALVKMTYRRINAIGAIDDILMVIAAFGAYGFRAMNEPARVA